MKHHVWNGKWWEVAALRGCVGRDNTRLYRNMKRGCEKSNLTMNTHHSTPHPFFAN